ncbi:MAG TPA: hypothetical protein DCY31_08015 [Ruminococcaceae bacterium]|nr:hypothetical protein [Oscillospiraceae bacterium]
MTELEKIQRAKMYIDKLANGVDPLTDAEIAGDSTLNNVRISRCLFYVSDILGKVIDNGGEVGRKKSVPKPKLLPFEITAEQAAAVEISEQPVGVAIIAKRINEVIDENVKKAAAVHISNWLVEQGYLAEEIAANKRRKVATAKGEALGIYTVDAISPNGVPIKKNVYDEHAQRFVVEHIMQIESNYN